MVMPPLTAANTRSFLTKGFMVGFPSERWGYLRHFLVETKSATLRATSDSSEALNMESVNRAPRKPGPMMAWAEVIEMSLGLRVIREKSGSGSGAAAGAAESMRAERLPEGRSGVSLRGGEARETPERRGVGISKARTIF